MCKYWAQYFIKLLVQCYTKLLLKAQYFIKLLVQYCTKLLLKAQYFIKLLVLYCTKSLINYYIGLLIIVQCKYYFF